MVGAYFDDFNERATTVTVDVDGTYTVQWAVPARPTPNPTFARFRLGSGQSEVESPIGPAIDGEVEDYSVPSLYSAASLTLAKLASPVDGTTFAFSHDVDASGNFNLSHGESKAFTDLPTGRYEVAELVLEGWRVDAIICSDSTAVVNIPVVTVELDQGEDVICTFQNAHANLPITLGWFFAQDEGDAVEFRWQTVTEMGVAGFNLLAVADGDLLQLNESLIPSSVIDSLLPTDYRATFASTAAVYYLQEVGVDGYFVQHGPFTVDREYGSYTMLDDDPLESVIWLPLVAR